MMTLLCENILKKSNKNTNPLSEFHVDVINE